MYMMWYDDSKTTGIADKIAAACTAYRERFHTAPTAVLLNADDHATLIARPAGVQIEAASYVAKNNIWVGLVGA